MIKGGTSPRYFIGQSVCFVDENQCEVKGLNVGMENLEDRLIIKVELDDGSGFYYATLLKTRDN